MKEGLGENAKSTAGRSWFQAQMAREAKAINPLVPELVGSESQTVVGSSAQTVPIESPLEANPAPSS